MVDDEHRQRVLADELRTRIARHRPERDLDHEGTDMLLCAWCGRVWPCDTAVLTWGLELMLLAARAVLATPPSNVRGPKYAARRAAYTGLQRVVDWAEGK